MRLLWLSHFIPYPPRGGAHQRSYNLIRCVSRSYEITLVAFNLHGHTPDELAEYEAALKKYCSRVEFWETPVRWKSARWGAGLVFSPLRPEPYSCGCFWSPETGIRWHSMLQQHEGALVHFDSIDLALFAGAACGFRKVLNHHNCESAMAARRAHVEPNPAKKLYLKSQSRKLARFEQRICPVFDVNLAVSEADAELLRSRIPKTHFHVVENGVDTDYFSPEPVQPEPDTLIFAGSLNWYPNVSAIHFFLGEIWPQVKLLRPEVRLYIAGMKPSDSLAQVLRQDPQIKLVVSPPDIRPWIARAAAVICPITDGGGTKVKLLDAMAMGKPIVSTSVGCEGLDVSHEDNVLVADTPEAFAVSCARLLEDAPLRSRLAASARAVTERKYSWEVVGAHLEEAYEQASHRMQERSGKWLVASG